MNLAKHPHGYIRLNLKLLSMLLLTALAAVALALGVKLLGNYLVEHVYCAPARQEARVQAVCESFRGYVSREGVSSTDVEKIGAWNLDEPGVRLMIAANGSVLNSDRWGAELVRADSGLVFQADNTGTDGAVYPVNFSDGAYLVQIQENSHTPLYNLVTWMAVLAACILFLALMLLYNSRVTANITRLARQVRRVSQGDLTLEIQPTSSDEIGDLAQDVDAMRLSILDKLHREAAAWQANAELITAMSHDVRTPLTTLMGYLDILTGAPDLPETQRQEYLEICTRKAKKLRELTAELFSYFLVFGKPEPDLALEEYDAQTLLDQLLGEQGAELMGQGYRVETSLLDRPGMIRVDVQHLRRVFDNLYSNLRKYADPQREIRVVACWKGEGLHVVITNHLPRERRRAESTRIGLQTCEKILASMGGRFIRTQTEDSFTAQVILPRAL